MFASALTLATLALAALSPVIAVPTTQHEHAALIARGGQNWPSKYEPYEKYHLRYTKLHCSEKHNTPFFKLCCANPLLKGHKLSDRPAECTPKDVGTASDDDGDDDCDDDDDDNSTTSTKSAPSSTAASPPKNTPNPPSSGSFNKHGTATWYTQDGTTGACGRKYSDNDLIVALNGGDYGDRSFSHKSSNCFRKVLLKNDKNGKTVTAVVADGCPGCGPGSVDLSVATFKNLASLGDGVFPLSWTYTS